jgi:putative membrane protein
MTTADLPALNAGLNALSGVFLLTGAGFIHRQRERAHRACMLAAFVTSGLFLVSYLVYHALHGSTPFTGQGPLRTLYFAILISHTILAAIVPPLAILTVVAALRDQRARHRRLARWTLPIWLYVSVTGVTVYWLLYRL